MGLLGKLLNLVQIGESANDSLEAELRRKALRLLGRTDVESEIELVQEGRRHEKATKEGATNVSYNTA